MIRSRWSVLASLALCGTAAAQPANNQPAPTQPPAPGAQPPAATTPAPAGTAAPVPAAGMQPPAGEVTPPPGGTPPVDGTPPPDGAPQPVPPPPPPPPPPQAAVLRTPGLLASSAADQHLATHSRALDHETLLPDHQFTASVFADYLFLSGPRLAGTVGMFRSFELVLGVVVDQNTTGGGMTGAPEMSETATRFMYGGNVGFLSFAGIQLSGGIMILTGQGDLGEMVPTGALSIPLDAHWLPFRLENTRVRATYPFGVGIEWGAL